MSNIRFLTSILLAVVVPVTASPTLVELTELAETRHADYLSQQASVDAEKENEYIARSALLPQVSASYGEDLFESSDDWNLNLSATQILLDFTASENWRAAEQQTEIARANLSVARQNLRRDVVLAWLDVQLAGDTLELVVARQKTLQEQLKRVNLLAEVGRGTRTDVLSAQAGLANARAQWEQAKHDWSNAHNTVERYTGVSVGAAKLSVLPGDLPEPLLLSVRQEQTRQNSLSALAAQRQIDYLKRLLSVAEKSAFPQARLSGGVRARGSVGNQSKNLELSITQPLFTGGNVSAQKRRLVSRLSAARWRLVEVMRQEAQEVERLHGQMLANIARMGALAESSQVAEVLLEAMIVSYNNGVRVAEDVIRAEEDLFDARLQLRREIYQYLRNQVILQTLTAADNAFVAQIEGYFILNAEEASN